MADTKSPQGGIPPWSDAGARMSPLTRQAPAVVGYLAALVMTAVAAALAVSVDSQVAIPNISLIFVVPVIMAAVAFGLGPSLLAAVLGAVAYNFFLTEPRYTLLVDDPANIWAIGLLFVVGLIVSGVAFTSRRRATDAEQLRRQIAALHSYSRDVPTARDPKTLGAITAQALGQLFQVPVVVIAAMDGNVISIDRVGEIEPTQAEIAAAQSSLATGLVAHAGVYPASSSRFDFWPVATGTGRGAVLGVAFDPDERPTAPETLVDIVGRLLALALQRTSSLPG